MIEKNEILKDDKITGIIKLIKYFDIPVSTLKTFVYDRKQIEDRGDGCRNYSLKKLYVYEGKFPGVENILMKFFTKFVHQIFPWADPCL